jgi:predicted acyltransferase
MKRVFFSLCALAGVAALTFPDVESDSIFRLMLLFSPLILALIACWCDFRERPGLPWARRVTVALLLANILFCLSLGYLGSRYLSDFTLYNRICELGVLVTIAQAIAIAVMKGMKWKMRTFSVASAVVLSVFWYLSKFVPIP